MDPKEWSERQGLASPDIEGAIGELIPYDVLRNGLVFVATYGGFLPYESIEFYIDSPGEITYRESVIISPQQAGSGKVKHGVRADNVAYLAGKDIQIYIRLPARGPGWTSLRRSYSVESAP
jgi:hypothetical protein